jgi:hypothetical protein
MISTIDGRIVADHWPEIGEGRREYERPARSRRTRWRSIPAVGL